MNNGSECFNKSSGIKEIVERKSNANIHYFIYVGCANYHPYECTLSKPHNGNRKKTALGR